MKLDRQVIGPSSGQSLFDENRGDSPLQTVALSAEVVEDQDPRDQFADLGLKSPSGLLKQYGGTLCCGGDFSKSTRARDSNNHQVEATLRLMVPVAFDLRSKCLRIS
jgi:hypothetical protein